MTIKCNLKANKEETFVRYNGLYHGFLQLFFCFFRTARRTAKRIELVYEISQNDSMPIDKTWPLVNKYTLMSGELFSMLFATVLSSKVCQIQGHFYPDTNWTLIEGNNVALLAKALTVNYTKSIANIPDCILWPLEHQYKVAQKWEENLQTKTAQNRIN